MTKKYLSLEEAAARLKRPVPEVNQLREDGELRGFADRGTWKFRAEDVEELARRNQPDSEPEIPLMAEPSVFDDDLDMGDSASKLAGSSVVLDDDDDLLGQQPTEIRGTAAGRTSDSDIRLVLDDDLHSMSGSSPDVSIIPDDLASSDSDVRLVDASSDSDVKLVGSDLDSDSDVKLADSDSDVRLAPHDGSSSDSDVRLATTDVGDMASDSDVQLLPADASVLDSDFDDMSGESIHVDDSGIRLEDSDKTTGSGLLPSDSGIRLQSPADSGISLEGTHHELSIDDDDSGIGLASHADSGQTLAEDSGIRLSSPADSGIMLGRQTMADDEPFDMTVPMLDAIDDSTGDTDLEVPMIDDEDDSAFELTPLDDTEASVIDFEETVDEHAATAIRKSTPAGDSSLFELEEEMEFGDVDELGDDEFGMEEDVVEFADEDDFADAFDSTDGESAYSMPMGAAYAAPAMEREWGAGSVVLTALSTVVTALGCMVAYDMVSSISSWTDPGVSSSVVLQYITPLFK